MGVDLAAVADSGVDELNALPRDAVNDAPVAGSPGVESLERELMGTWSDYLTFLGVPGMRLTRFNGCPANRARRSGPAVSPWSWGDARAL